MVEIQQMVFRGWLSLLVVLLLLFLPAHVRAEVPKAEKIFQKLLHSFQTVDFIGKRVFMSYVPPEGNPVLEEQVIRKAPDKQRIEVISPPEMSGTIMVISGKEPNDFVMIRGRERRDTSGDRNRDRPPPPPPTGNAPDDRSRARHQPFMIPMTREIGEFPTENVQLLFKNYNVRALEGGRVAGRRTYLLEIDPKLAGKPSRKVWTDAEVGVVLKMEHYDFRKRLRWLFAYDEINFKPGIDESVFRLQEGTQEGKEPPRPPRWDREELWNPDKGEPDLGNIRKRAQLSVVLPDQIPAGFVLRSIYAVKFGNRKNVHLRYTDGLTILSVFQSSSEDEKREDRPPLEHGSIEKINIGGVECEVISGGPMSILRWSSGGVYSTLIGELDPKEMAKIASSFISG